MKRRTHQRPGVVLLLALVLMAAIVSSTIAIATSVVDSSHQSKNLDDFVIASLAADSGLERSLNIVKVGRSTGANIVTTTNGAKQPTTALVAGSTTSAAVDAGSVNQPVAIPQLKPQDSVTFDLLGYNAAGSLTTIAGSATISVVGDAQHCSITPAPGVPATCGGRLEIDWVGLDTGGQPFYSGRAIINNPDLNGSKTNNIDLTVNVHQPESDAAPSNIGSTSGFRITVRALDNTPHTAGLTASQVVQQLTVKNITITQTALPTCSGGVTCTSGVIGLTSTGLAGTSQSVKKATVLWQLPASQLFNYVVFTEGDIIPAE